MPPRRTGPNPWLPSPAWLPAALGLLCLLCAGCPTGPPEPVRVSLQPAQSNERPTEEQTRELAQAEGELTWYTSLPQGDAETLLAGFTRQYPFIRTRLERGGSFTIAQRVTDEIAAGRVQGDVLHVLDPSTFVQLRNQGALLYYDPPEARDIPAQHRDVGYWTALRAVTLGLAYNPRTIPAGQAPGSWEDLQAARFQGRVGLKDAETAGAAYALYFLLRERYGTAFWGQLAAQQPRLYKTAPQMVEALTSGEITVAAGIAGSEDLPEGEGQAGLRLVWPSDGLPMIIGPVAILAAAPHPNCARLFISYVLSAEGQRLVTETVGAYSLRPDLPPPAGRKPLTELRLILPAGGWEDYAAKRELLRAEFARLLGEASE